MHARLAKTLLVVGLVTGALWLPPLKAGAAEALAEKIELCASCHGEDGRPTLEEVPIIWGQEFYYLYVQLKDYKAGRRANEVMQGIVEDLGKDEMQQLAQHFSEKEWPATGFRSSDAADAAGKTAAAAGQCVQCHLGGYEGNSRVPRLAGQTHPYLRQTMEDFKNKVRMNSPAKSSLMDSYSSEDIDNMARYLAAM